MGPKEGDIFGEGNNMSKIITKYHRLGGLYFLTVLEAKGPRQDWFLSRASVLDL